jgi:phosphoribosylformimino-5-aminoimidazole carboxamide ribotide isomerase
MDLMPAIDVLGESAVRLVQGDYARVTTYGDPVALARSYAAAGARWVHLVDLAAARSGVATTARLVSELLAAVRPFGTMVQLGGGVRSAERAESLLADGVARVVLGTAALEQPGLVDRLATAHPGRVAVGLDHRAVEGGGGARPGKGRVVAVAGWQRNSPLDLLEAVSRFEHLPLAALVVTDIGRDGMLAGPDLAGYAELLTVTALPIVASGGISSRADIEALASLEAGGRRLAGAVVGKALLDGRLTVGGARRAGAAGAAGVAGPAGAAGAPGVAGPAGAAGAAGAASVAGPAGAAGTAG